MCKTWRATWAIVSLTGLTGAPDGRGMQWCVDVKLHCTCKINNYVEKGVGELQEGAPGT